MQQQGIQQSCNQEQWNRVLRQLDSRHQAYVHEKTRQHSTELRELQETVKRNLATERRLLEEQLANHRSALSTDGRKNSGGTESRKPSDVGDLASPVGVEERRHLCDHLTETVHQSTDAEEIARLRAALAARERELATAEDRLARSRKLCDNLLGRLSAAEAELQFLRNRRSDRRTSASIGDVEAGVGDVDATVADSLRQSLAELEQRQLIDTADALELPGDPADLERRYDCLQVERREIEAALTRVPRPGSVHHTWHSARDQELLEKKLDNIDRELVHLRNSLKQFKLI